ncbi:MAG: N-acetyltransferase family protein [bacterium]
MLEIRDALFSDVDAICRIYNHYVLNTIATFEEQAYSVEEYITKVAEVQREYVWLVAEEEGQVIGYAYASPWRNRCAFRHTLESSVYLDPEVCGKGAGTALYKALIERVRNLNFHILVAVISLPNPASIALHQRLGFHEVGVFKEVGYKFEQWIDVTQWQLMLSD